MTDFVLIGGYADMTINLSGHQFVDGVFRYGPNEDNVVPSETEVKLKADFLAKNYQAFIKDSPEYEAAIKRLGEKHEKTEGLSVTEREQEDQKQAGEQQHSSRQLQGALRSALTKLDASNDDHWTSAGLPSVEALRELSGQKDVSRADINLLAPNLNREEATKVQSTNVQEDQDPLD